LIGVHRILGLKNELEHENVQTKTVRLHVATAGPADGPVVLLLHGFPEFWFSWRNQIMHLAEAGYRVIVPDQRGYNLSDKPWRVSAYGLDTLTLDALRLIEWTGCERAYVVGHDWGAAVAWWVAVCFPDRVRKLGILNLPHPVVFRRHLRTNPVQRRKSRYMLYFQFPWYPERKMRRDNWLSPVRSLQAVARPGTFSDEDMERYREAWRQPGAARGMLNWYRAGWRYPPRKVADVKVKPETLVIWGAADRWLGSEMLQPSLDLCLDGRAEIIEGGTHWVQHEFPESVNRLLLDFLR
jgi:pimeloyl-ACP methyl ester carboxylesterase